MYTSLTLEEGHTHLSLSRQSVSDTYKENEKKRKEPAVQLDFLQEFSSIWGQQMRDHFISVHGSIYYVAHVLGDSTGRGQESCLFLLSSCRSSSRSHHYFGVYGQHYNGNSENRFGIKRTGQDR